MVCAATLANDLHMGPLAWRWVIASSYLSKKRTNLCVMTAYVCVCVLVCGCGFMNERCGQGSSQNQEEPQLEQRILWQTCLWSL